MADRLKLDTTDFLELDSTTDKLELEAAAAAFVPYPNPRYALTAGHQPMSGGMQGDNR